MTWSKFKSIIKRLDDNLTGAVYLHGCHLTGQKTGDYGQETLDETRPAAVFRFGKDKRETLLNDSQHFVRASDLHPRRDAVQW